MKHFIVRYGCYINSYVVPLEAENIEEAREWAYEKSIEEHQSYEGLHGVLDFDEYCEENEVFGTEAEDEYEEYRDGNLDWYVEEFNPKNLEHEEILAENGWRFDRV